MKFEIPADADSADDLCIELGDIATACEFKRAALVYARVRKQDRDGRPQKRPTVDVSGKVTTTAYAKIGIHGLRSKTTIIRYWDIWQQLVDEGYVEPAELGDEVEIPEDLEWADYYLRAADSDEPIVDDEFDPLKPQKRQPKQPKPPAPGTEPSKAAQEMGKGDCPPKAEFVPEEHEQEFRDVPLPGDDEMAPEDETVFGSAFDKTLFKVYLNSAKREIVRINESLGEMAEEDVLPEGSKAAVESIIESWTDIQNAVSKKEEEVNEWDDEENTDI